jgi:hypothetical protein
VGRTSRISGGNEMDGGGIYISGGAIALILVIILLIWLL